MSAKPARLEEQGFTTVRGAVEKFDRACVDWVVAHRRPDLDRVFVLGSHSGEKGVPWALLLVLLRAKARGGDRVALGRGLAATFGGWAAARVCKKLDHRHRPCHDGDSKPLIKCPKSSSLPSDEAACAFGAAAYASRRLPYLTVPLYLGAAFTAASRVYVGVHYPSDVAAGALIGLALGDAFS